MDQPKADANRRADAEFDAYAPDYGAGMDNTVKALAGGSADDFVALKLHWLLRRYPDLERRDRSFRILDYGCGIATMLRLMAAARIRATLLGCDVSAGMLETARQRWPAGLASPMLYQQDAEHVPVPDRSVDLVIISAVLHHVAPDDRTMVYAELARVLRQNGRLAVFEHNPLNPLTRYVVAHTPIDANAVLLRAGEVCTALRALPFADTVTRYLMFLPPRFSRLAAVEDAFGWLPFGAQYAVTARRI